MALMIAILSRKLDKLFYPLWCHCVMFRFRVCFFVFGWFKTVTSTSGGKCTSADLLQGGVCRCFVTNIPVFCNNISMTVWKSTSLACACKTHVMTE